MISRSLAHFLRGKKKTRGIDSTSLLRSGVPFEFQISWDRPWFAMNRKDKTPQACSFFFFSYSSTRDAGSLPLFFFFYNTATTTTFRPITLAVSMRDQVSISFERISRRVHSNLSVRAGTLIYLLLFFFPLLRSDFVITFERMDF